MPDPSTGQFTGFPAFLISNYNWNPQSGLSLISTTGNTINPYVGIDSYAVPTGTWKKTSFVTSDSATIDTTVLWRVSAPSGTDEISGVPNADNSEFAVNGKTYVNWIKTQDDMQNLYRGASELWQRDESWWWNSLGWSKEIYTA